MLEIRNLCTGYSDKPVLKDISVTAAAAYMNAVLLSAFFTFNV